MYAVIRETTYAGDLRFEQTTEFREFQDVHAARTGYRGTIIRRFGSRAA